MTSPLRLRRMAVFTSTLAAVVAILGSPVRAQDIAASTFDAGLDGWTIGEFWQNTATAQNPSFVSTGGNPGGFVRATDVFGWNAYLAPTAFLGDQSAAYGGSLSFGLRVQATDPANIAAVVLTDGALRLQFRTQPPAAGGAWTAFDVPLLAFAGWEVAANTSGGPATPATEAQLQQVLGNLTALRINADWNTGDDQVDLDNVRLSAAAVPEPGTLALLPIGALALAGVATRRRRPAAAA